MFRWAVKNCGVSVPDAVMMLSATPAEITGATSKGRIAKGKDADIVLFDMNLNLKTVVSMGKINF